MLVRILSGAVLTIILGGACAGGRIPMFALSMFISAVGMLELYKVVGINKKAVGIVGYVLAAGYYLMLWLDLMQYMEFFCVFACLIEMFTYVISFRKIRAKQAAFAFLGIFYVAIPLSFLFRIRMLDKGIFLFILLFVCSWIADTFAYFTGMALGKHRPLVTLSPKKSVEGAIGGIVITTLVGFFYGLILDNCTGSSIKWVFMAMSFAGSIISIFGDLAASAIKRNYDIKDYGRLIPGHGGILDRFDSMIFVAPLIYTIAYFFM